MMATKAEKQCAFCGEVIVKVYRSPHFCEACDKARIDRINKALAPTAAAFGMKWHGTSMTTEDE